MRKSTIATLVIVVVVALGAWLALNNPFSFGASLVEDLSERFLEDLQFKDFRSSALYHHNLDQERLDIGKTLETLFAVKPEFLDITDYRVVRTDIDSSGERAKVIMRTRYKVLNKGAGIEESDVIVYWIKRTPDCPPGGRCDAGTCKNETGKVMYKPAKPKEKKTTGGDPVAAILAEHDAEVNATDKPYTCDPTLERKWYMNLDSTLKKKNYSDAKK